MDRTTEKPRSRRSDGRPTTRRESTPSFYTPSDKCGRDRRGLRGLVDEATEDPRPAENLLHQAFTRPPASAAEIGGASAAAEAAGGPGSGAPGLGNRGEGEDEVERSDSLELNPDEDPVPEKAAGNDSGQEFKGSEGDAGDGEEGEGA
ncbi:hypothetical protein QJS04_geneDACA009773 [Acorus gramineus]|uniref:Uncharacterized protein n=1 Tax=Acorus gramineus TaxID=55184 RepID=A0AAV9B8G3_ACOGR|nr:hypothetical protein QJS04_geneDACA009773 [Acorus gramineus]